MVFHYELPMPERIDKQIADSREEPALSRKPELLGRKVRWPRNHDHPGCGDRAATIVSVSTAGDLTRIGIPPDTTLVTFMCDGCGEGTSVQEDELVFIN